MASTIKHFKKFSVVKGDITASLDLSRFEGQFQEAQEWLDVEVMNDMKPHMPKETGNFIQRTQAMSSAMVGTGIVVAAAPPYGRFLYEGRVMVDAQTGNGPRRIPTDGGGYVWRFRKGAKLKATNRPLTYSNPNATPHWFDTAKQKHLNTWVEGVKERAGGGK